jgi:hypothetical protein
VVFDLAVIRPSAMFGGCRVGEMPLYEGCARNEWYVVKVDYLLSSESCRMPFGEILLVDGGRILATQMSAGAGLMYWRSLTRRFLGTVIVSV